MPSSPPPSDFDAGATPRSTLQKLANKPDDGRVVVDAIIVKVQAPDRLVVTNDFADSMSWTLVAKDIPDIEKRFVLGGHYTLLVLVQNGEKRGHHIIDIDQFKLMRRGRDAVG